MLAFQVSCSTVGDNGSEGGTKPSAEHEISRILSNPDSATAKIKGAVLLFTAPECPLCLNYAPALADFADSIKTTGVKAVSVVSGTYYSHRESQEFLTTHNIDMPLLMDTSYVLSRHYGAGITPEAVLIDSLGEAVYRGAIDNWAISLGRKRLMPTEHYLRDAVSNYLAGREIDPKTTDAVGCFIE